MILSNKLSQFKNKKILLLVSSKQNMCIYKTSGNTIKQVSKFEVILPSYSDNEGHFKIRSKGRVMKSGSVREVKDSEIISRFIKKLKQQIKFFNTSKYESVYLYCPSHIKKLIIESLPVTFQKKILIVLEGNYYHRNPKFLLEKLSSNIKKKKFFHKSAEAQKILKKSNKARRVIKGKPDKKLK